MSKEADIAIFVKSNNNDSQVPQKKTKFSCSLKTWGSGEEFSLVKMSIPQGDKMFVGEIWDFDFAKRFDVVNLGKLIFAKTFPEKCS